MSRVHWSKQVYYAFIPLYPISSLILEGFRDQNVFTDYLTQRQNVPVSQTLSNIVEKELDKVLVKSKNLKNIQFKLSLTHQLSPITWGSLLLKNGAEYQLPLIFEVNEDCCLRRYIEDNYPSVITKNLTDEDLSKINFSEAAKSFAIRRELERSFNGYYLCVPSFLWVMLSTSCYGLFSFTFPVAGPVVGCIGALGSTLAMFPIIYKKYKELNEVSLDSSLINESVDYKDGARDYLKASNNMLQLIGPQHFGWQSVRVLTKRIDNLKGIIANSQLNRSIKK